MVPARQFRMVPRLRSKIRDRGGRSHHFPANHEAVGPTSQCSAVRCRPPPVAREARFDEDGLLEKSPRRLAPPTARPFHAAHSPPLTVLVFEPTAPSSRPPWRSRHSILQSRPCDRTATSPDDGSPRRSTTRLTAPQTTTRRIERSRGSRERRDHQPPYKSQWPHRWRVPTARPGLSGSPRYGAAPD